MIKQRNLLITLFILILCLASWLGSTHSFKRYESLATHLVTGDLRVFVSIVLIAIFLSSFATTIFLSLKYFENPFFYKNYKLYWWVSSMIFSYLYLLMMDIELKGLVWLFFIFIIIFILILTILPAAMQSNKKRKQDAKEMKSKWLKSKGHDT